MVFIGDNSTIGIWFDGSINPWKIIPDGLSSPENLFVTLTGDIYIVNSYPNNCVDKFTSNLTNSTTVMYFSDDCYGFFIDIYDNLYCSLSDIQQVVMKPLGSSVNTLNAVAGTACPGNLSTMLNNPSGIFVDINLNLYVADAGNNRIQMFPAGQLSAITKAGNGVSDPFTLYMPNAVILDADGYLFIVDSGNNRILGQDRNGFRCLVGCSGSAGSESDQLNTPTFISFDTYGNMFVTDALNSRIQKFLLETNSSGKSDDTV